MYCCFRLVSSLRNSFTYFTSQYFLLSWLSFFRGYIAFEFFVIIAFGGALSLSVVFRAHLSKDLASSRWLRETDADGTLSMQLLNGMIANDHQFSVYNSQSMHNVTCCLRLEDTWSVLSHLEYVSQKTYPEYVHGKSAGRLGMGQNWVP